MWILKQKLIGPIHSQQTSQTAAYHPNQHLQPCSVFLILSILLPSQLSLLTPVAVYTLVEISINQRALFPSNCIYVTPPSYQQYSSSKYESSLQQLQLQNLPCKHWKEANLWPMKNSKSCSNKLPNMTNPNKLPKLVTQRINTTTSEPTSDCP